MTDAASFRMNPKDIDATKCLARRLREEDKDTRWSPAVYREHQCSSKPAAGSDLCAACAKNLARYTETCKGRWNGYITEEPIATCHMLGTVWAKKCVFKGGPAPSRDDDGPDYDADAEWWAEYIRTHPDALKPAPYDAAALTAKKAEVAARKAARKTAAAETE